MQKVKVENRGVYGMVRSNNNYQGNRNYRSKKDYQETSGYSSNYQSSRSYKGNNAQQNNDVQQNGNAEQNNKTEQSNNAYRSNNTQQGHNNMHQRNKTKQSNNTQQGSKKNQNNKPYEGYQQRKSKNCPDNIHYFGKGYRFERNGWIYIHIEGEPYKRGFQHGFLLAKEIKEIMDNLKFLTYWNTGKEWSFFVKEAERQFTNRLDIEYLYEIKGIADGAYKAGVQVTWQEILAWNGYGELIDFWWPYRNNGVVGSNLARAKGRCSAFIATGSATKNKKILLAHNTWENFETGQYLNIIIDIVPKRGNRILMQTAPGYIDSFSDFFVTGSGLLGADTSIAGFMKYNPNGIPQFVRIRKAIQYADDMTGFVDIMKERSNGGYTSMWLLGDIKTNKILRFEQGLDYYNVKTLEDGYFIGFNAPEDPRIRNLEVENSCYTDIRDHQGARRVRLTQLLEHQLGKLDIEAAKDILADHYDVYLNQRIPSSRTIDGHYELDDQKYPSLAGSPPPFSPQGTLDGKIIDSDLAKMMAFCARWGNSSGMPFITHDYFANHPQWNHLKGHLKDRFTEKWSKFRVGEGGC